MYILNHTQHKFYFIKSTSHKRSIQYLSNLRAKHFHNAAVQHDFDAGDTFDVSDKKPPNYTSYAVVQRQFDPPNASINKFLSILLIRENHVFSPRATLWLHDRYLTAKQAYYFAKHGCLPEGQLRTTCGEAGCLSHVH